MSSEHSSESGYVNAHRAEYDGRYGPEINLGLANSPIGPEAGLEKALRERDPVKELASYPSDPYHDETREALIDTFGLVGIGKEAVVFSGNGSYGAGDEVINYLAKEGVGRVFAPIYSFPNVAQWTGRRKGIAYTPVIANGSLHPDDSLELMSQMQPNKLRGNSVYIDYPNNPTGDANPTLVRKVVDNVGHAGGIPIVDMAFGETLGDEFGNIAQYTLDRGGIVLGSLSKTQGMPGLRTGYAILSPQHTSNGYSGNQRLVFGLSGESEFVYRYLLTRDKYGVHPAKRHAKAVAEYSANTNTQLYDGLRQAGLHILQTDIRTPIQVVASTIHSDLYQRLGRAGLVTESLADYGITTGNAHGYGDSAVRMLTPSPGQVEEVLRRVEIAVNL
ncbi:pyridoxal phosphate-dependent aminotransferase [Candidatus Woesebacteria bacterium]|nr:MAG: pyridoxal phosphate-dependent aminotransferase [Candidatus Woesebacteria bacterium]